MELPTSVCCTLAFPALPTLGTYLGTYSALELSTLHPSRPRYLVTDNSPNSLQGLAVFAVKPPVWLLWLPVDLFN